MIDANEDGSTNVLDFIRMKKIASGAATGNADRNADGEANAADQVFVQKFLLLFDQKLLK